LNRFLKHFFRQIGFSYELTTLENRILYLAAGLVLLSCNTNPTYKLSVRIWSDHSTAHSIFRFSDETTKKLSENHGNVSTLPWMEITNFCLAGLWHLFNSRTAQWL